MGLDRQRGQSPSAVPWRKTVQVTAFRKTGVIGDTEPDIAAPGPLTVVQYMRAATEAAAALSSRLDLDEVLQTVVTTLVASFDSALARVWLYDSATHTLRLRAGAGLSTATTSSPDVIDVASHPYRVATVARTREPFIKNGLQDDCEFDQEWIGREGIASVAAFPLLRGGELHGVMVTFSRRTLADDVVDALNLFATMVTTALHDVQLYSREREARALAEEAGQRLEFVAEASRVLTSSLDYETTLANVAHLSVSQLADWCVVDVVEDDGEVRRIEVAHRDPQQLALAREVQERYPPRRPSSVLQKVLTTGEPVVVAEISESDLESAAQDDEHLRLLRRLGIDSYMCVPLRARGRIVGAITFVAGESRRHYDADDLDLAEHLARRAAVAIDNARLYRDLQASMRLREEFVSSITHDLKNPLAAIKGQAQLLERRTQLLPAEDAQRLIPGLESITGSVTRMTRLLNNLLDVARLQLGTPLELEYAPSDLVALARQVVHEQEQTGLCHHLRIEPDGKELVAEIDPARVERVLSNLIGNAVKFSPQGGEIVVRLHKKETDGTAWAVIEVADQGVGIPEADLPRVFERFHRGSNVAGKISGTGIGLAGVKQIVEQHHGTVSARSRENQGATFTVRLPLHQPSDA